MAKGASNRAVAALYRHALTSVRKLPKDSRTYYKDYTRENFRAFADEVCPAKCTHSWMARQCVRQCLPAADGIRPGREPCSAGLHLGSLDRGQVHRKTTVTIAPISAATASAARPGKHGQYVQLRKHRD